MKAIILFALCIISISQISALEFSPAVLNFQTQQNQQACGKIFFTLDSEATLSDTWAENENIEWRVTQFTKSAQNHEIQINYPSSISQDQTQTEVCLTPSRAGNYRGALIFRQEQTGNSIVQFVVWLNLSVSGNNNPPPEDDDDNDGSSSRSRSRKSNNNVIYQQQIAPPKQNFEELSFPTPQEKITLGENQKEPVQKNNVMPIMIALTSALFLLLIVFILIKR